MNVHVNRPGKYIKCRLCLVGLKWGLRFCISMPIKVRTVQAVVFPVDMYGCESWIIKEAEGQSADAFKLWCWGRLLRVSWTARRSNQSILKEINPEYSLKGWCWNGSSNTLATWCEELTHWKRPWSWERLRAEGEVDDRGWDGWIASLTQWTWVSKLREMVKDREVWCDAVSRVAKNQTWLNDSATTTSTQVMLLHKYILELPSEWQGTIAEMLNMVELEDSLNPD